MNFRGNCRWSISLVGQAGDPGWIRLQNIVLKMLFDTGTLSVLLFPPLLSQVFSTDRHFFAEKTSKHIAENDFLPLLSLSKAGERGTPCMPCKRECSCTGSVMFPWWYMHKREEKGLASCCSHGGRKSKEDYESNTIKIYLLAILPTFSKTKQTPCTLTNG